MTMGASPHTPVMIKEVLEILHPVAGHVYVDATFGRGGYTRAFLDFAKCRVIALDRDAEAISFGKSLQDIDQERLTLIHGRFSDLHDLLKDQQVSGVVFDLGVSSPQLDEAARGFSFQQEGPLDMGMGLHDQTAADVVNKMPEKELADLIWRFGEERRSRAVAQAIVAARKEAPLTTTTKLAAVIRAVVRKDKSGIDPATRTFQALRIYVNEELQELTQGLKACEKVLAPGGRLVVVSFHSLEDSIVKNFFKRVGGKQTEKTSRHHPFLQKPERPIQPSFQVTSLRVLKPSREEERRNPRARSARLRWAERTAAPALSEGLEK